MKDFNSFDLVRLKKREEEILVKNNGISKIKIGKSILGEDICAFKIGEGGRRLIYVGAHHALEYLTAEALVDFLEFLAENAARDVTYRKINLKIFLKTFTVYIIPCLNPDGIKLHLFGASESSPFYKRQMRMSDGDFSLWQSNARGVDLNHNYDCKFEEYKRLELREGIAPGKTKYSGEYPESEPESYALANFVRIISPQLIISLHSQGEEIYYSPKNERMRIFTERIAKSVGYKAALPTGTAEYGGFCDYTGERLGIPSLTVELGLGKNPLPYSELRGISERARQILLFAPVFM